MGRENTREGSVMGEIAEMMLEGVLCQYCGVLMDDYCLPDDHPEDKEPPVIEAPGYPRTCADCAEE